MEVSDFQEVVTLWKIRILDINDLFLVEIDIGAEFHSSGRTPPCVFFVKF